jgi:hypothetical protein
MFTPAKPYQFDTQNPFAKDPLQRGQCAENLTALVTRCGTPMVMTLSAPWGQGKTTFVKMWAQHLRNQKVESIYFNCWENDYADDPLLTFMGAIQEYVDAGTATQQSALASAAGKMKDGLKKVVKASPKIAINWLLRGGLHYLTDGDESAKDEIDAISEIAAAMMEKELEKGKAVKTAMQEFKNALQDFAKQANPPREDGTHAPLVVFVDELDRCRPSFAVELLERIKHLFAVEGVVFVLAVDRDQLAHASAALLGFNPHQANGYLRRFIDFDYILPEPAASIFSKYFIACHSTPRLKEFSRWCEIFAGVGERHGLSLRDIERWLCQVTIIFNAFPSLEDPFYPMIAFGCLIEMIHPGLMKNCFLRNEEWVQVSKMMGPIRMPESTGNIKFDTCWNDQIHELILDWSGKIFSSNEPHIKSRRESRRLSLPRHIHNDESLALVREFTWSVIEGSQRFRMD